MNLLKNNKNWLTGLFLLAIAGGFAAYKYAYKPHKTTESLVSDFTGSSSEFLTKISINSDIWIDKTVELTGLITSKDDNGITLNNTIYCQFREAINFKSLNTNQKITLKGRVIGYDNLLEELKLNQCIIIK